MTQDELKSILHYSPITGNFTWLERRDMPLRWNNSYAGAKAGTFTKLKYVMIRINKKPHYAHRLAFLYMNGSVPEEVDHIDGNPSNNSFSNLRAVNRQENMKNISINSKNKSGTIGVRWDASRGKWMAGIQVSGRSIEQKRFTTREEAELHRKRLEEKYQFHENHGRKKAPR